MNIRFIYTDWNQPGRAARGLYGGCGYYRVVKPAEWLQKKYKWKCNVHGRINTTGKSKEELWTWFYKDVDLAVVRHVDNDRAVAEMYGAAKYFKVPIILDMDDNYHDVPTSNPATKEYSKGSYREFVTTQSLKHADGVTVSTPELEKVYRKFNSNIAVLPNCNDIADWPQNQAWRRMPKEKGKIRILYAGSKTHDDDLRMILPALQTVFKKYPQVEMVLAGNNPQFLLDALGDRVQVGGGTPGWEGYNQLMYALHADIAIAPLVDTSFTRCKSHIKWMEYSMYGYPVIASNNGEYAKYIKHGKTGLLSDNTEQAWTKAITDMVERPGWRKKMAKQAYADIQANQQWEHHIEKWKKFYEKIVQEGKKQHDISRITTTSSARNGRRVH